jgi:hypothetical protein
MRITRHLATFAIAAIATTSVAGLVAPRSVSAAPSAESALVWLEGELNDNGGSLPFSFDPTLPDWGLTIDAILALNNGGRGTGAAAAATTALAAAINDYITGESFGDVGSHYAGPIGKAMLAATLQGADVHTFGGVDLEALSRAAIQPSGTHQGRFSDVSNFGDFSNGFGQALNILALSYTAAGVPANAADFLLAQQCPAGGFRLYYDAADPLNSTRGCESDAEADTDATALAVDAMLVLAPSATTSAALHDATTWLIELQDPATGGFPGTGLTADPNSNTTGLAVQALEAAGFADAAAAGRAYVGTLQLTADNTAGTPAVGEEGAIALNPGAFNDARTIGITPAGRGLWQRATAQAVLAFAPAPFAPPRADVVPVVPARLLDTRTGQTTIDGAQAGTGPTAAGSTLVLQVTGRGGVPADAAAAVLNITADNAQGPGYVTAYACDAPRPLASSLNFVAGTPVPNAVITNLSASGTVCLFVAEKAVNLIADVGGYFPNSTGYRGLTPARLLDTRSGQATIDGAQMGAGQSAASSILTLPIAGRGGVPADADAVVLNVTVDGAKGAGYVTVYACDAPQPVASNVNFADSAPIANAVITKLSATGTVCLFVSGNSTDLIADVGGYFPRASGYNALTPARLLDTRAGQSTIDGAQLGSGPVGAGSTLVLPIAGRGGVPADATSVVLNVTADGGQGAGFVTVYACDAAQPAASNLNFVTGIPSANAAITALSATGTVCLFVAVNAVNLVADVSGYFG